VTSLGGVPDLARQLTHRPLELARGVRVPTLFIDAEFEEYNTGYRVCDDYLVPARQLALDWLGTHPPARPSPPSSAAGRPGSFSSRRADAPSPGGRPDTAGRRLKGQRLQRSGPPRPAGRAGPGPLTWPLQPGVLSPIGLYRTMY
jgi:hypothetical protein